MNVLHSTFNAYKEESEARATKVTDKLSAVEKAKDEARSSSLKLKLAVSLFSLCKTNLKSDRLRPV